MRRLVGAAAVLATAAFVAVLVTRSAKDEPTTLTGHGLSVRLPAGWEGRMLPPRLPATPGPMLRATAPAGAAVIVLRDVTALYAPLGSPLGFPRVRRATAAPRFQVRGRLFEQEVETNAETAIDARAVVASLTVRPLARGRPRLPRVQMEAMPALARRVCRASRLLRPICVSRVPAGAYPRSGIFFSPIGRPGERYDVFELNGGRPRPRRLVLLASRYGLGRQALADWTRLGPGVGLHPSLTTGERSAPLLVSAVRWGDREGNLVLEDADGGPLENHLVFRWHRRGIDYAAAIRAWEPLAQTTAALRAIVLSIPR